MAFTLGTPGKPAIFILGLQHAREYIAGSTVNYLVWDLLTQDTSYLSDYEFVVVPIANPDGYEFSFTTDRLWRKNRRPCPDGEYGVDLNRNYDSEWGLGGSSQYPSSDVYMGPSPQSEPEVQAITSFFLSRKTIVAAFDFHSYSQLLMRPWGWTTEDSDHESQLSKLGGIMVEAIQSVRGTVYQNIKAIELYTTTGSAGDWMFDSTVRAAFGYAVYSFDIELVPQGDTLGFILPTSEILPCGQEMAAGMKSFLEAYPGVAAASIMSSGGTIVQSEIVGLVAQATVAVVTALVGMVLCY